MNFIRITAGGIRIYSLCILLLTAGSATLHAQIERAFGQQYADDAGNDIIVDNCGLQPSGYVSVGWSCSNGTSDSYVVFSNNSGAATKEVRYDVGASGRSDTAWAIVPAPKGDGYYVCGTIETFFGAYGTDTLWVAVIYLMKIDCDGKEQWTHIYLGQPTDPRPRYARDMAIYKGDLIIAGWAMGESDPLTGATYTDGLILRVNGAGAPVWRYRYDGSRYEWFNALAVNTLDTLPGFRTDIIAVGGRMDTVTGQRQALVLRVDSLGGFSTPKVGSAIYGDAEFFAVADVTWSQQPGNFDDFVAAGYVIDAVNGDREQMFARFAHPCTSITRTNPDPLIDNGDETPYHIQEATTGIGLPGVPHSVNAGNFLVVGERKSLQAGTPTYEAFSTAIDRNSLAPQAATSLILYGDYMPIPDGARSAVLYFDPQVAKAGNAVIVGRTIGQVGTITNSRSQDLYLINTDAGLHTPCDHVVDVKTITGPSRTCIDLTRIDDATDNTVSTTSEEVSTGLILCDPDSMVDPPSDAEANVD
jgi:hypothetical protein